MRVTVTAGLTRACGGLGLAALLVLGSACGRSTPDLGRELTFADQGRQHLEAGDRKHPPYNSLPPTSGWHWEMHAANQFLHGYLDQEIQVHELEHGKVLVQYNCDNCPELVSRLWKLTRENPDVIVAPNFKDLKARVVLTAWTKMLMLDDWDEAKALDFIKRNAGNDRGD